MSNFDCIFINGDSYSAPKQNDKVYADFLADRMKIPVINLAISGSNNDRITRSSIESIEQLKTQYRNPLIIIGWSFIRRLEVWYYGNKLTVLDRVPDSDQSRFITLDHLINANEATVEQKCLVNGDFFIHKQLMNFYTNLYTFAHTLESQNLSYIFFSGAKNTDCSINCFPYIESLSQVQWVANNKKIYKLHEFCIMHWAKENDPDSRPDTGHLSTAGHEQFAQFILNNMLG
jgi:hypothetical protein